MQGDADHRLVEILERIVRDSKELQRAGRLQDPMSRMELTELEDRLRKLQRATRGLGCDARP